MAGRIVVIGLGPGDVDLLTVAARDAIERCPRRFLRTRRHPAASILDDAHAFDDVYDSSATLDEVYRTIVAALLEAAAAGDDVLYAVPGSPVVAERTVELLLASDADVVIEPALSFLDLAWARLAVDPVAAGVRLVDGHRFAIEAAGERGPLLVAQCDSVEVLSDVKLALDAGIEPCLAEGATVVVLQRLGLADEAVTTIAWTDLDRIEPDHLTSVYVPELVAPVSRELARFVEQVAVLRDNCPWDREQTHESLRRHLLEEAYEVLEAIDQLDVATGEGYDHLEEELGDLLFQVLFHARLAAEEGRFTIADVAQTVHDKLRDRHPHVFGDVEAADADAVMRNWELLKKDEKSRESVFDGVPVAIPALLYALKIQKKAASLTDDVDDLPMATETQSATDAFARLVDEQTTGELLFAVVDEARRAGVDPETALRAITLTFRDAARRAELGGASGG